MVRAVKFGFTLPQFGASWAEVKEAAFAADDSAFDSVWVADHFFGAGAPDPLEAWTEMTAVAAITKRIEVGSLVLCNSYRQPALLAKMAATLDHISDGRLILGYGAGWFQQEYDAYGYEYPSIRTRLEQLEEGLEILKKMWGDDDQPTFHGVHYNVENARCLPKPHRKPHPPILVGGGGEQILLRLVARYADIWNNLGLAHGQVAHKLSVLTKHCGRVGRNIEEIEVSQQTVGAIALDRDEARRRTDELLNEIGFLTGAPELCPTGTPDEIIERIRTNVDLGITTFVINFGRRADIESIRLFSEKVIPAFR